MKKFLVMLLGMLMLSATAFAAESVPCFWTPDGIVSFDDNIAAYKDVIQGAQENLAGDKDHPLIDDNQKRMDAMKSYAADNKVGLNWSWNADKNSATVFVRMTGESFPINTLVQRLNDVNHLLLASHDPQGGSELDKIISNNGTINLLLADQNGKIIGFWQHNMQPNEAKTGFTQSKVMILASEQK